MWLRATVPLFFVFFSHFAARPTPPYRTGGGRSVSPGGPLGHWHGRQRRVRTVRTQYYLSTPIRGQCARLPRPASHKPHLLLPHDKGAFVGEEDQHPVVGPRPTVPRPRGMCPCWQTRRPFLAGERDDNPRPLTAFCIVWKDKWGAESPPAVLVLSASSYSSFSARLAKGASCSSRRSPGSSHSLTTLVLPLFTLSASPPYPRVAVAT